MLQLIQRLRPLISTSANAVGAFYKHLLDSRANHSDARMDALEKSIELQAALSDTMEMRIKILQESLDNVHKTLRIVVVGLIATATIAGIALAAALLR